MEFDGMRTARPLTGILVATLVALIVLGVRQTTAQIDPRLPAGPNRELVARKCSTCHDLSNLYSTAGRTRDGWNGKISDMVVLYGLELSPQEYVLILDYLATYLPP
jgi:hypothetical protein